MNPETPLEREENLQGKKTVCLACRVAPPEEGDLPPEGWMVGVFKRQATLEEKIGYEVRICPTHKLYTAPHQVSLLEKDGKIVMATPERAPAKCRHCGKLFPEVKSERVGWGVAKLERWTPHNPGTGRALVIALIFPLCPNHTLAAGP